MRERRTSGVRGLSHSLSLSFPFFISLSLSLSSPSSSLSVFLSLSLSLSSCHGSSFIRKYVISFEQSFFPSFLFFFLSKRIFFLFSLVVSLKKKLSLTQIFDTHSPTHPLPELIQKRRHANEEHPHLPHLLLLRLLDYLESGLTFFCFFFFLPFVFLSSTFVFLLFLHFSSPLFFISSLFPPLDIDFSIKRVRRRANSTTSFSESSQEPSKNQKRTKSETEENQVRTRRESRI